MASIVSKIIAGEMPGYFVWQDDICVAIMTIQPINDGHLLVIPREDIDHWDDLPEAVAAHMLKVSKKLARAIKAAYPCQRVGLVIAGFEVPHTHIHLIPANSLADFDFNDLSFAEGEQLQQAADKIKAQL